MGNAKRQTTRRLRFRAASLLAALLAIESGCSSWASMPQMHAPVPDDVVGRTFSVGELVEDVDHFIAVAEEVHPDLYAYRSRAEMLAARDELIRSLRGNMTRVEFQPHLARFVARFGDGHTSVQLPWREWWQHVQQEHSVFPCDVVWDGHELRVRRTAVVTEDGAFGPGTRLTRIDDQPVEDLVGRFLAERSGESEAFLADGVEGSFPVHLWLAGIEAPYRLHFESRLEPGRIVGITAPGMPWGSVPRGRGTEAGESGPWSYSRLDDGTAYLDIRSLGDRDAFGDFLDATFDDLALRPPPGIIVDLRQNGGGNSQLGDDLLDEITDIRWRQFSRKDWKASERYREFLGKFIPAWLRWLPVQYAHPRMRRYWTTPDGELAVYDIDFVEPSRNPRRFDGPVIFLVGPGTFSSATSLAAAVKDYELAVLMGSETGGLPGGFGEIYPFDLPNTHLAAQVSSARFIRPNGALADGHGVRPDLPVPVNPQVADNVLDAAQAWIAKQAVTVPKRATAP